MQKALTDLRGMCTRQLPLWSVSVHNLEPAEAALSAAESTLQPVGFREAGLSLVAGTGDVLGRGSGGGVTEALKAARFVAETAVDCLAIPIGNVRGRCASTPRLDSLRLAAIREAIELPPALQGDWGIDELEAQRVIDGGVTSFNVNAELRERYFCEARRLCHERAETLDLVGMARALAARLTESVTSRLAWRAASFQSTGPTVSPARAML